MRMSSQSKHTYPAFVYENDKYYFADCLPLNISSAGESPYDAVENLEQEVRKVLNVKNVSLKPLFEKP